MKFNILHISFIYVYIIVIVFFVILSELVLINYHLSVDIVVTVTALALLNLRRNLCRFSLKYYSHTYFLTDNEIINLKGIKIMF